MCAGGVELGVELVLEVVVEPLGAEGVEDDVEVVGAGALEVVVTGVCGQDSAIDLTPGGRLSEEIGEPGGNWKYSVCPVISVTVTVQPAAEAAGSAATPITAATTARVASPTFSFPRLSTVALSPPDISCASLHPRHDRAVVVPHASY